MPRLRPGKNISQWDNRSKDVVAFLFKVRLLVGLHCVNNIYVCALDLCGHDNHDSYLRSSPTGQPLSRPDQTEQKGDRRHEEEWLRSPRPRGNGARRAYQPIRRIQVRVPQSRRAQKQVARQQAGRGHVRSDIQVHNIAQEGRLYTSLQVSILRSNLLSGTSRLERRTPAYIDRQKL